LLSLLQVRRQLRLPFVRAANTMLRGRSGRRHFPGDAGMTHSNGDDADKMNLSRRGLFGAMAGAAAAVPILAQAQPAPAPASAPAGGAAGRGGGAGRGTPGGSGPIKVLFISKYHPFDRENLFLTLDSMG
jgi:hypothetical protein